MLTETLGHTRMLKWNAVGAAHWFVMVAFIVLFLLVLEAYFEVVDPAGGLPIVGHGVAYGLVTEVIGVLGLAGIGYLIYRRQREKPGRANQRAGSSVRRCGRAISSRRSSSAC